MLHVFGQLPADFVDLAFGYRVGDRLGHRTQHHVRSIRIHPERADEFILYCALGHRPIRSIETSIKLRLELRGKLRDEMLSFLGG